jgi:hypothetical protein
VRKRVILLCVVPTLVLGITYFFLIEYILREYAIRSEVVPLLRYGGAGLVLLFTLVALACGIQITDGISRPLRALLRVVDGDQAQPGHAGYLPESDVELRYLFLRVHTLVQQNRSGAQTLSELESLSKEVDGLCRAFREANERMRLPGQLDEGHNAPTGELTQEVGQLCTRLREDLDEIERELRDLSRILTEQETAWAASRGETEGAVREIERLGTVWSLEIELARKRAPELPGSLGSCYQEFNAATERLRAATGSDGGPVGAVADLRGEVARMRETVDRWLGGEAQREEAAEPPRGE